MKEGVSFSTWLQNQIDEDNGNLTVDKVVEVISKPPKLPKKTQRVAQPVSKLNMPFEI